MNAEYDLVRAQELVKNNDYILTHRVRTELTNHALLEYQVTQNIFSLLNSGNYYKTVILENHPSKIKADIYKLLYNGDEWYVKFFINEDEVQVEIWSLKSW